jgi:membrane-associated protease RseP (regulator of RpoE activity)
MKLRTFVLTTTLVLLGALPVGLSAQPGSQPFVFYGEEPWGGSYLGVDTRDITPDRVSALRLKDEAGVEITMVDQDAPAGKAGLKEHDVILTVNQQKVESVEQLRRLIREIPVGRSVNLEISRDGRPMDIKAQLAERNKMMGSNHEWNFDVPPVTIPAINIPAINIPQVGPIVVYTSPVRSGLMIENLTPQLGIYFGVKDGNGVLVRSVDKGSRAEQAGFRAGDVIVKVNGSAVSDCTDFSRVVRERKESKAAVTILRDRKEQNLTLTLPESKRTGSVRDCELLSHEECVDQLKSEVYSIPELATAEIKRLQPELERQKKQLQEEMQKHGEELKKEMQQLQEEMKEHQQELQHEMKKWVRDADI